MSPDVVKSTSGGILKNSTSSSSLLDKDLEQSRECEESADVTVSTPTLTDDGKGNVFTLQSNNGTPLIINQTQLDTSVVTPILHATPMDTPRNTPNETSALDADEDVNRVTEDEISNLAQQLIKIQTASNVTIADDDATEVDSTDATGQ